ncbi:hypothetical protein LP316_13570 [Thalassotalea sp. LPB0316]|uniref:hypothetical protein n=1 Tax=Thalassotalea sp. LPB0316 TaxID=2769490 RepID=UPI0018676AED|nr:hypothetical protein [Thalassotalea sp. LPB0316]QOL25311.1 hypothetical protein LP316_13570 [Thalassotalea sp. LPB0316]
MRQLNSLGQVVSPEASSTAVTFKNLKNDQQQQSQPKAKAQQRQSKDKVPDKSKRAINSPDVERRSGKERRQPDQQTRKRWIESRQQPDRREPNQQPKVRFVI